MVKFRKAGDNAAYEIADGVFDRDEASKLGLAVVEIDPTSGAPTAYGRYKNAPDGGPLGITVASPPDTEVVAGGDVGPGAPAPAGGKGALVNPNDPVIHGGSDEIHKDGAEPPVEDLAAENRDAAEIARQSIEDASKPRRTRKAK
jgi:hypothetical protein